MVLLGSPIGDIICQRSTKICADKGSYQWRDKNEALSTGVEQIWADICQQGLGNSAYDLRRSKELCHGSTKNDVPSKGHAIDKRRPEDCRISREDEWAEEGFPQADVAVHDRAECKHLNI